MAQTERGRDSGCTLRLLIGTFLDYCIQSETCQNTVTSRKLLLKTTVRRMQRLDLGLKSEICVNSPQRVLSVDVVNETHL